MSERDPQNPYFSPLVEASAGSGKTYQLSKRFLNLVASGAQPATILTITFTVKAAGEMRSRIIMEATKLLSDEVSQKEFDCRMKYFYNTAIKQGLITQRPKSALQTAKEILSATQSLKISTIDSLFNEWVSRFPWEAGQNAEGKVTLPYPYRIVDDCEQKKIEDVVWARFFIELQKQNGDAFIKHLVTTSDRGTLTIDLQLKELERYHGFIWQIETENSSTFFAHSLPSLREELIDEKLLINWLKKDLETIARQTSKAEEFCQSIASLSFHKLQKSRLLTQSGKISGTFIKGKKREMLSESILRVEETISLYQAFHKLKFLNEMGSLFFKIYRNWLSIYDQVKYKMGVVSFSDLTKACYRLFSQEAGMGASWLIQKQIKHLLIDEFQDTSLLQWEIFEKLTCELLSGQGVAADGVVPTTFIVGDRKQSIYGFREADPIVMDLAQATYNQLGGIRLSLNQSFRTAQVILDFINRVFDRLIGSHFGKHETAKLDGKQVVPDVGRVVMSQIFTSGTDDSLSSLEKEAKFVAEFLKNALSHPQDWPIFDKKLGDFRPLRASDCCVLYRSSTHADIFEQAMRELALQTRREERKGFFSRREVKDLLALLKFLAFPGDEIALFTFLRSPFAGLSDLAMVEILSKLKDAGESTLAQPRSDLLWQILSELNPQFSDILNEFRQQVDKEPAHILMARIFRKLGIFRTSYKLYSESEAHFVNLNIMQLLEVSHRVEADGFISLSSLVSRLTQMAEIDGIGVAGGGQDAITLMTIHKAKGLEFGLVCVIEAYEPWFKSDLYWLKVNNGKNERGLAYVGRSEQRPENYVSFERTVRKAADQWAQESVRLLYVALTRASQYLVISGHKSIKKQLGPFYKELADAMICNEKMNFSDYEQIERGIQTVKIANDLLNAKHLSNTTNSSEKIISGVVLKDATLVSPNQELDSWHEVSSHVFQREHKMLGKLIGSYIHTGLEAFIKKQIWQESECWQKFVEKPVRRQFLDISLSRLASLREEVKREVYENLVSENFQNLLKNAISFWSEQALVYRESGILMRGVADLIIRKSEEEIIVVDFKTIPLQNMPCQTLRELCIARFYHKQLLWYAKALRAMYPLCRIRYGVWFTYLKVFVDLT